MKQLYHRDATSMTSKSREWGRPLVVSCLVMHVHAVIEFPSLVGKPFRICNAEFLQKVVI